MAGLGFTIKGTAGVERLRIKFLDLSQYVADVTPFLERVMVELEEHTDEVFDSEGSSGSGKWAPLSPVTEEIRAQTGFGGLPILENTGRLRNALGARRGTGALRGITNGVLVYGTNGVPYASFHQTGAKQKGVTKKQQTFLRLAWGITMKLGHVIELPARPPVDFGQDFKRGDGTIRGLNSALRKRIRLAAREFLAKGIRRAEFEERTLIAGGAFGE